MTFYLVNARAAVAIEEGRSKIAFVPFGPDAMVADPDHPGKAVAVARSWLEGRLWAHGMKMSGSYPGRWSGPPNPTSHQDIVIVTRV